MGDSVLGPAEKLFFMRRLLSIVREMSRPAGVNVVEGSGGAHSRIGVVASNDSKGILLPLLLESDGVKGTGDIGENGTLL